MDYAYTNPAIGSNSENVAESLAKINYMRLANKIIYCSIEILRDIIMDVESLGDIKLEQTPNGVEPYTMDNALYDICFNYGHLSSAQALRLMIEPCFENLRIIKGNNDGVKAFFADTDFILLHPEFEDDYTLYDKLKKTYHAIYENQYGTFSEVEFRLLDNWQDIYITVTCDLFVTLHNLLEQLEMSMYIPF